MVVCGSHHVIVKTEGETKRVYGWGWNEDGQTGQNKKDKIISLPTIISSLQNQNIKQISAGNTHSLAITFSGSIFTWGSNKFGGKNFFSIINFFINIFFYNFFL